MVATILILFLFAFFSTAWIVRWTRVAAALPRIDPQADFPLPQPTPLVSVILPVRNEEENIRDCIESLLRQTYRNLEVIVVDDQSDDRTPEILREIERQQGRAVEGTSVQPEKVQRNRLQPEAVEGTGVRPEPPAPGPAPAARFRVIQGEPCPPDWMGKNHALDQGYREAGGEFLLFVDADTRAHPGLIEKTVGFALESNTGLLTLLHSCEFQCFWDSVVNSLILYLAPFQNIEQFNDPANPKGNANGPFMLFRRDVYERIGGHAAIKGEVVEDLVIARRAKEAGFRLTWAIAPELFISRPYASLAELRKGWGKVLFRCMELNPKLIAPNLLLPLALLAYVLIPWAALASALVPGLLPWSGPARLAVASLALAQITTVVAAHRFVKILFRLRPTYPWAYPLAAPALAWIQWEACFRVLTGRKVAWKGREYREEKKG
jgi:chlorobactene glucosyltransferase